MIHVPLLRGGEPYRGLNKTLFRIAQTFIRAGGPPEGMPQFIGPSLAIAAISEDEEHLRILLDSPNVKRLNIGPIPTWRIALDQPHEGNLFEHLYGQRAIQRQPTTQLAVL